MGRARLPLVRAAVVQVNALMHDGCAFSTSAICQTGHAMEFGQLGGVQYVVDRMRYQLEFAIRFADTPVSVR